MLRKASLFALGLSSLLGIGCGESASPSSGITEPLRVKNGQFVEGSFPKEDGGTIEMLPLGTANSYVPRGLGAKKVTGHAELGGESVAIGVKGLGTGYWIVPMGPEDLNDQGTSTFDAILDFSASLEPGPYEVLFAAVDGDGKVGEPFVQTFTIRDEFALARIVASLDWDSKADLDLHIVSPSGKELDPKHPNTGYTAAEPTKNGQELGNGIAGSGELDRDSNAACVQDGFRRENVMWGKKDVNGGPIIPEPGEYQVKIHMWSACTAPAASFDFTLTVDGEEVMNVPGRMLDIDADGGAKDAPGLYIGSFTCDKKGNCH